MQNKILLPIILSLIFVFSVILFVTQEKKIRVTSYSENSTSTIEKGYEVEYYSKKPNKDTQTLCEQTFNQTKPEKVSYPHLPTDWVIFRNFDYEYTFVYPKEWSLTHEIDSGIEKTKITFEDTTFSIAQNREKDSNTNTSFHPLCNQNDYYLLKTGTQFVSRIKVPMHTSTPQETYFVICVLSTFEKGCQEEINVLNKSYTVSYHFKEGSPITPEKLKSLDTILSSLYFSIPDLYSKENFIPFAHPLTSLCSGMLIPLPYTNISGMPSTHCDPIPEINLNDYNKEYTINGYYSTYDILAKPFDYDPNIDPYPATTTCSVFVVTGGHFDFIQYFKRLIQNWNTLNHVDIDGNLLLNIDPTHLVNKKGLLSSTKESPISLKIKMLPPAESDAYYCDSFVQLVSVN